MQKRCPGAKALSTAVLPNYKLVFTGWSRQWKGAVASAVRMSGDRVRGALYEISGPDLKTLDGFEGYPNTYDRVPVTVFNADDEPIEAFTYVKSGSQESGQPGAAYLEAIQQGYREWRLF